MFFSETKVVEVAGRMAGKPKPPCASPGVDPEWWFSSVPEDQTLAKSICQTCNVRELCLQLAEDLQVRDGIWGGRFMGEPLPPSRAGATTCRRGHPHEVYRKVAEKSGRAYCSACTSIRTRENYARRKKQQQQQASNS